MAKGAGGRKRSNGVCLEGKVSRESPKRLQQRRVWIEPLRTIECCLDLDKGRLQCAELVGRVADVARRRHGGWVAKPTTQAIVIRRTEEKGW